MEHTKTVDSLQDLTARWQSEPDPSPDELVARAVALRPFLRERQAETEERGYPAKDMHDALTAAGFYRIYIPRRFGGLEYHLKVFQRVMINVAQGCSSTGWFTAFGAGHALPMASYYSEKVAARGLRPRRRTFSRRTPPRPEGTARPVDGGWIVNGTWPYASGVPYATHFMGTATILNADGTPVEGSPPRAVVVVIPADRFTMLEDWGDDPRHARQRLEQRPGRRTPSSPPTTPSTGRR